MKNELKYKASLRSNGEGKAYFTEFRHPLVLDPTGTQGKKIKKGLGLDHNVASKIVDELNWLLSNSQIATTELARTKGFDEKTIDCFFGPLIKSEKKNKNDLLGKIKKPTKSDGYVTLAVIGATGSGKTSLIRNLIGTDPSNIAFPAVSSNRTTTATIEYIFNESPVTEAAVVFSSETQVEQYIKENIIAAIREQIYNEEHTDSSVADALLTHTDMKFKLGYVLGHFRKPDASGNIGNEDDYEALRNLVQKTRYLKVEAETYFQNELVEFDSTNEKLDYYIDYYFEDESSGIDDLVDEIIALIKNKFSAMKVGTFEKLNGWPLVWHFSGEKETVLKQMEYFAGNDGRKFGQLYAPLVTDIRIKAKFEPYRENQDIDVTHLTIIDTIGIGHSTKAIDSLDSEIIDIATSADLIVYVDNGSNPINQTANVAIRDLITSGNGQKMIMAYTQLDRIEDLAAIYEEDKKKGILKVLSSALKGYIDFGVNRTTVETAEKRFRSNILFLSKTHDLKGNKDNEDNKDLREEIDKLFNIIYCKSKEIEEVIDVFPRYDYGSLYRIVDHTLNSFITGFKGKLSVNHWTRVKAMTHRISQLQWDGYDSLKPVSSIMSHFNIRLDDFIKLPVMWRDINFNECNPTDKKKLTILELLVQNVTKLIKEDVTKLLIRQQLPMWDAAYKLRGTGSAAKRLQDIENMLKNSLTLSGERVDTTPLVKMIEQIINGEIEAMAKRGNKKP
ncbi:hypothetical protein ACFQ88_23385 [Paenibacillus sp. NPDC056579]|uniref:hypothetical protein n=1 Tax=Paenibacillus sp. NPDC056579 TaxID=3345871 RepID=UPI0036801B7B